MSFFFFSSRRRHTRCALVTGVQTCALPISHGLSVLGSISKPFTLPPLKALLEQAAAGATGLARTTFQPLTPESIRAGLAAGAVELAYQPKVAVRDHRMIGVEAFLRWRDVDGKLKSPAEIGRAHV